jgi:hypothetical protein
MFSLLRSVKDDGWRRSMFEALEVNIVAAASAGARLSPFDGTN